MARIKIRTITDFEDEMVIRDHALEKQKDSCPGCKRKLRVYEGDFDGVLFKGVKCPKGCKLAKFWVRK